MRSLSAALIAAFALAPGVAQAQNTSAPVPTTPAPAAPVATSVIAPDFAAPPGATVTLEVDARDADLLGMVKDLLSGMSEGGKGEATMATPLGPFAGMPFEEILKNVTHLRLIQYKKLTPDGNVVVAPGEAFAAHEKQFAASGGRRLLYSGEGTRILIMGFDAPRGMAFVTEDGSKITVGRFDGAVNLKPLSTMIFGMTGMGMSEATFTPAPSTKPAKKPARTGTPAKKAARG